MKPDAAEAEIDKGIAAVEMALHGDRDARPRARRSFAFPTSNARRPRSICCNQRGIAVFGADLWASDWDPMTPKQQLKLLIDRLKLARKGIILLHDPKAQTAAMLPAFLRYLRDNHYRVVHLVPAAADEQPAARS